MNSCLILKRSLQPHITVRPNKTRCLCVYELGGRCSQTKQSVENFKEYASGPHEGLLSTKTKTGRCSMNQVSAEIFGEELHGTLKAGVAGGLKSSQAQNSKSHVDHLQSEVVWTHRAAECTSLEVTVKPSSPSSSLSSCLGDDSTQLSGPQLIPTEALVVKFVDTTNYPQEAGDEQLKTWKLRQPDRQDQTSVPSNVAKICRSRQRGLPIPDTHEPFSCEIPHSLVSTNINMAPTFNPWNVKSPITVTRNAVRTVRSTKVKILKEESRDRGVSCPSCVYNRN
ncbi:unnamed protein product [Protopolystoma xenopodis]|uniref:Uncharacterized protein n=1 Tax=Protopolystoma xenopodis TaxID=117903 RepID=A0A3S5A555_9PLAT|nr:unnamed protein product [Protopolystoma xenopodis]